MKHFRSLAALHQEKNFDPPENPLISVVKCGGICGLGTHEFTTDFFMIAFKKMRSGIFSYGKTKYDHQNGSMFYVSPRQVVAFQELKFEHDDFLIFFHEDFLSGDPLFHNIKKYNFFNYDVNEALHLSPAEEKIIWELHDKIKAEYLNNEDEYSREIIIGHIDSMLRYSQRYYKRQFINRKELTGKTTSKFNKVLNNYAQGGLMIEHGAPTVKYMAEQLNLSSHYLTDLLKQETGKTALELIHIFLISEAKNLLADANMNVSEAAYALGFDNLSYFSRLFKREAGLTPKQFQNQFFN